MNRASGCLESRLAELEDGKPAVRPQDPRDFSQGPLGLRHVPDPERDRGRVAGGTAHRNAGRIAADELNASGRGRASQSWRDRDGAWRRRSRRRRPSPRARDERSRPRDRRFRCTDRGRARSRGSVERINGPVAPPPIESGTEHAVQQVVPRRDGVEHPRDAAGGLVGAAYPFHDGYSSCVKPSAPRILPAMKSARSSSVFGFW